MRYTGSHLDVWMTLCTRQCGGSDRLIIFRASNKRTLLYTRASYMGKMDIFTELLLLTIFKTTIDYLHDKEQDKGKFIMF